MTDYIIRVDDEVYGVLVEVQHSLEAKLRRRVSFNETLHWLLDSEG